MNKNQSKKESDVAPTGKQTKRQQAENYLIERYAFRFNELTGGIEYREKDKADFANLSDYQLNSFCRELDFSLGLSIGIETLEGYLKSDFTPTYHPTQTYFNGLPKVTGKTTIEQLAATVKVENSDAFLEALTKWLTATVANTYQSEGCQNQTCLVLTGQQGAFKTTWLNKLCPPDLLKYLYTGRIDVKNKDTYILLPTTFIVNLDDQLKTLNKGDAETVKTLISHGNVTVRLPFGRLTSRYPRIAAFCGSINGSEFLSDATGSRRFLPFEVEAIDIDAAQAIDINQVWAEALALYNANFQYWFTSDDTARLFGSNEAFQVQTTEFEMLTEYYEPGDHEKGGVFQTTTQILNELQGRSKTILREKQLGEALRKMQFVRAGKKCGGTPKYGYYVRVINDINQGLGQQNYRVPVSKMA